MGQVAIYGAMDSKARVRYHLTTNNLEIFHNGTTHCICRPFEEFKKFSNHPAFTFKLEYSIPKVKFHWWNPRETNKIESNKLIIATFVTKLLHNEKYLHNPQVVTLLGLNGEEHFDISAIERINFVETANRARKHYIIFDTDEEKKQFASDFHFVQQNCYDGAARTVIDWFYFCESCFMNWDLIIKMEDELGEDDDLLMREYCSRRKGIYDHGDIQNITPKSTLNWIERCQRRAMNFTSISECQRQGFSEQSDA